MSHSVHPVNTPSLQQPLNVGSSPQEAYRRPKVSSKGKVHDAPPTPPEVKSHQPATTSKTPPFVGSAPDTSSTQTFQKNVETEAKRPKISQSSEQISSVRSQPTDPSGYSIHNFYHNGEADKVRSKGIPAYSLQYFQTDSSEVPYSDAPLGSISFQQDPAVLNRFAYTSQGPPYSQQHPQSKLKSNQQGQPVTYRPDSHAFSPVHTPLQTTLPPILSEPKLTTTSSKPPQHHFAEQTPTPQSVKPAKSSQSYPAKQKVTPAEPTYNDVPTPYPIDQESIFQHPGPSYGAPAFYPNEPKLAPQQLVPPHNGHIPYPTGQSSIPQPTGPINNAPYPAHAQHPDWQHTSSPHYGVHGQVQNHVIHPYPKPPSITDDPQGIDWTPVVKLIHHSGEGAKNQVPVQAPKEQDDELEPHQVVLHQQFQHFNQPVEPPPPHPFIPRPPVYVDSAQLLYGLLSKETNDDKFLQHEPKAIEPKPTYHVHHAPQNVQSGYSKINYQPVKVATESPTFYNPYGSHQVHIVPSTSKPFYSRPSSYESYRPDAPAVKPPNAIPVNAFNPSIGPQFFSFTFEDTKPKPFLNANFNPVPPVTPEVSKPFYPPHNLEPNLQSVHQPPHNNFQPNYPKTDQNKYSKNPEFIPETKPAPAKKGSKSKSSSRPKHPSKNRVPAPTTYKPVDKENVKDYASTYGPSTDYIPFTHTQSYDSIITTYKPQTDYSKYPFKHQDPITTYRPENHFVPVNYQPKPHDPTTYRPIQEINSEYPPKVHETVTTYRPLTNVSVSKYQPEHVYYAVSEIPPQKVDTPVVPTPNSVTEAILPPLSPEEIELLEGEAPTEPSIPEETASPPVKPVIEPPPPAPFPPYASHKKEKKPFDFTPIGPFPSAAFRPKNKQPAKGVDGANRPLISPNQRPYKLQLPIFGDYGERIQPLKRVNEPVRPEPIKNFDLEGEAAIEPEPINEFRPIPPTRVPDDDQVDTFIVFRKPEDELEGLPPLEEDAQFFDDTAIQFEPSPVIRNRGNPIPEMIELAASVEVLDKSIIAPQTEASTDPVFFVQTTTSSTLEAEAKTEHFAQQPEEFVRTSTERKPTLRFTTSRPTEDPLESEAKTEAPVFIKPTRKTVRKPIGRLRVGVQRRQRNESRTTSTPRPVKRGRFLVIRNESVALPPQFNSSRIRFPPRVRFVQNSERFVRRSRPAALKVDSSDSVDSHSTLREGNGLAKLVQTPLNVALEANNVPEHTTTANDGVHTTPNVDATLKQVGQVTETTPKLVPIENHPLHHLFKKTKMRKIVE